MLLSIICFERFNFLTDDSGSEQIKRVTQSLYMPTPPSTASPVVSSAHESQKGILYKRPGFTSETYLFPTIPLFLYSDLPKKQIKSSQLYLFSKGNTTVAERSKQEIGRRCSLRYEYKERLTLSPAWTGQEHRPLPHQPHSEQGASLTGNFKVTDSENEDTSSGVNRPWEIWKPWSRGAFKMGRQLPHDHENQSQKRSDLTREPIGSDAFCQPSTRISRFRGDQNVFVQVFCFCFYFFL